MENGISASMRTIAWRSLQAQAIAAARRNNASLWFVPDDLAGVYTDSTGTTPATAVGDVIGLITDRSYGSANLGAELFSYAACTNISGTAWTKTATTLDTVGGTGSVGINGLLIAGKTYRFSADITGGNLNLYLTPSVYFLNRTGSVSWVGVANGAGPIMLQTTDAPAKSVTNISVREVLGSHATKPTTSAKPLLTRLANGKYALSFDGSNDSLALGSGAILQQGSDHFVTAGFELDAVGVQQTIHAATSTSSITPAVARLFVQTNNTIRCIWKDDASATVDITAPNILQAGVPYVVTAAKVGSLYSVWINGLLATSSNGTLGATTLNAATIGAFVRTTTADYLKGKATVCLGQSTLTDADRKIIERFAASLAGSSYT